MHVSAGANPREFSPGAHHRLIKLKGIQVRKVFIEYRVAGLCGLTPYPL